MTILESARNGWSRVTLLLLAVVLIAWPLGVVAPRTAAAQIAISVPHVRGDQLLFFFDARPGRISFLSVGNPSSRALTVEVAFYPDQLDRRLGEERRVLAPSASLVLDPSTAAGGIGANRAGLVVVTPIQEETGQPVVPPEPLSGSFTLANTILGAAFGENAFGRLAVDRSGARAAPDRPVDGSKIRFQRFVPDRLVVPGYFDPAQLAPPELDGNRIILVAFDDRYADHFDVVPSRRALTARFVDAQGVELAAASAVVEGVLLTTLEALAGTALERGGKVFLSPGPGNTDNLFGIFAQSLGTYASGQRLPSS